MIDPVYRHVDAHRADYVDLLRRLLRIPSASFHNQSMGAGADFVAARLSELGGRTSMLRAEYGYLRVVGVFE